MNNQEKAKHEPLFHIVKRSSMVWWKSWLIRIGSVAAALLVCALITVLLTGKNPLSVYATMIDGSFGTSRRIWALLQNIAILLCISLAVTPAFKMRFWNTGAEGQVLIGALATASCMILFGDKLPTLLLFPIMIIASIVAGAIWGLIPAVFRAKWNTNETLFTLMMNYIAIQIVSFFAYKGLRSGRYYQQLHQGRLASLNRRARLSHQYHNCCCAHCCGFHLSSLQQARI